MLLPQGYDVGIGQTTQRERQHMIRLFVVNTKMRTQLLLRLLLSGGRTNEIHARINVSKNREQPVKAMQLRRDLVDLHPSLV